MPNNEPSLETIEDEIESFTIRIEAAEDWAPQYRKNRKTFKSLIRQEAKLERRLRKYFREFAARTAGYINTFEYQQQAVQAFDVSVIVDEEALKDEEQILITTMTDSVQAAIALGADAGEKIYTQPIGISKSDELVMKAARKQVARLVKQVSNTSRDRIRQAISTSLEVGETLPEAIDRVNDVVNDPRRAETIAQTEIVNSYQTGLSEYAKQAGAVEKEWHDVGAVDVCASNTSEGAIPMGEKFGSGHEYPAAHPHCRCGVRYIFPEEIEQRQANGSDLDNEDLLTYARKQKNRPAAELNEEIEDLLNAEPQRTDNIRKALALSQELPKDDAVAMMRAINFNGQAVVGEFYSVKFDPKSKKIKTILKDPKRDPLKMTPDEILKAVGINPSS